MKKAFFLVIILGVLLTLLIGETGGKEPLILDKMASVLTAGGVQVEGYYLEGWALLWDSAKPAEVWETRKIGEKLGLDDVSKRAVPTVWGDRLQAEVICRDYQARVVVQNIQKASEEFERRSQKLLHPVHGIQETSKDDLIYISVKYTINGSIQESLSQEKNIKETLSSLGKDHGVYLAVKGRIGAGLDEEAQLAWGEAVYGNFGAKITDTLRTGKYISMTGYTHLLPDAAKSGRKKINLNLSMVRQEQGTQVILGTPIISCEY